MSTNSKLPLNDEELAAFEATRDLAAELLIALHHPEALIAIANQPQEV